MNGKNKGNSLKLPSANSLRLNYTNCPLPGHFAPLLPVLNEGLMDTGVCGVPVAGTSLHGK